jgi:hypothetical protein
MFIDKYGFWMCDGIKFDDKYEVLVYASQHKKSITFHYHDMLWRLFDRSLLGKIPLKQLYKERAQQLRDKYDYLILYYSGGSDSHNVLRSFVDNNIKLDEVCIKWPKQLMDGKFYTPNTQDQSARNYWSEWDYSVKPSLEWLSKNYPEIKITFKDYIADAEKLDLTNSFDTLKNHGMRAGILLNSLVSDSERAMLDKGKTVANIYGTEKPRIGWNGKDTSFHFTDLCFVPLVRSTINPTGGEGFYWTPDMPILAFEQAYQMSLFYKANPNLRQWMYRREYPPSDERGLMQQLLAKQVIYDNWDGRFQAEKPTSGARLDKFAWFMESSELTRPKNIFVDNVTQRTALISKEFLVGGEAIASYKNFITISHYLETYDD